MVRPSPLPTKPPDFICVGRPRCGTRFLYDALQCFRDVWMPPVKEVDFWTQVEAVLAGDTSAAGIALSEHGRAAALRALDPLISAFTNHGLDVRRELEFCRRYLFAEPKSLKWYMSLFGCAGERITGDITPAYYALAPKTIAEVRNRLPSVRIIAMARDPAEQLWSLYNTDIRYGRLQARRRDDAGQVADWLGRETHWPVIGPAGLRHWREAFPDLLVVDFDDLTRDPANALAAIGRFIGCSDLDEKRVAKIANVKDDHTPAAPDGIRRMLEDAAAVLSGR